MDIRFASHNLHHESPEAFSRLDPHLRLLGTRPLVHQSALLDRLPLEKTGIFTLSGGRQIGKTTLMKQWMVRLMEHGVSPGRIVFLTGELIDDHHSLIRLISEISSALPEDAYRCLILDEVTYVRDWDKGVKYLADAGILENTGFFLTGSDLAVIREARMRFPGRRGSEDTVDFHLFPLSFLEAVRLKQRLKQHLTRDEVDLLLGIDPFRDPVFPASLDGLFAEFEAYLLHGGFLTAINDLAQHGQIQQATYATYSDWIRGDCLKRDRREHFLREILAAIIKRHGSQVTWNSLTQELSIDHPKTVADYLNLLASMDAVFIQYALLEDKLVAAPKKARKVMFRDPFIFHAVRAWLSPGRNPYTDQAVPWLADPKNAGALAESCATTLYQRHFPTYYIKAQGEVDIAYVHENRFWPVEIKWTSQVRPADLKQVCKYPNGVILGKTRQPGLVQNTPILPLPLALLRLESLQSQNF